MIRIRLKDQDKENKKDGAWYVVGPIFLYL